MSRPPKPFSVLKSEGRSHRTKSELEQRRKGEEALLIGVPIRERPEVKSSERAHEEFQKINETVINPPAELGRLTDAGGGEQSIKIENSAV